MTQTERIPDLLTPDQAATFLQLNRETVYRYIRAGKLDASRLGRSYRIPRRSVESLLQATRVRPLRTWSDDEIAAYLAEDELDDDARAVVETFDRGRRAGALSETPERRHRS
ncbi:MAG: helix-turn-helix domain-containing protein [Dehalococcoidia bacterium]